MMRYQLQKFLKFVYVAHCVAAEMTKESNLYHPIEEGAVVVYRLISAFEGDIHMWETV